MAQPQVESSRTATVVTVAGIWRRAAAGLVDALVVVPSAFLCAGITGLLAGIDWPSPPRVGWTAIDFWLDLALAGDPTLWGGLGLGTAVAMIYLLLFQVALARTPGMRLLGLRIIDVYGDPPSVLRAGIRTAGYVIGTATLSLGFLWIGFDREKRGLHDWLAGTYVIRERAGPE